MSTFGLPGQTVEPETVAAAAGVPTETAERVLETLVEIDDGGAPWRDRETLERLYVDEGLSNREIAAELECSPQTIRKWRHRFGLRGADPRRDGVDESEGDEGGPEQTAADELLEVYHEQV